MTVTEVFGTETGPWHAASSTPPLAWCGVRQQFRHTERVGRLEDVTCSKCRRAIRAGHERAWRS